MVLRLKRVEAHSHAMFPPVICGFPKIRGTILGGPHHKDSSTLGSPCLGKLPYVFEKTIPTKLPES